MLEFKGGSISKYDWEGMKEILQGCRTVLEFGTGISTKLFQDHGLDVTSVETDPKWIERAKTECPRVTFVHWNNKDLPKLKHTKYDVAFVDGKEPRDKQIEYAKKYADKILLHDYQRATEQKLIKKYLSSWKQVLIKGRTGLFVRANHRYASMTSCSDNYTEYLKAFLVSMDGMKHDFHIFLLDVNSKFIDELNKKNFSYKLYIHPRTFSQYSYDTRTNIAKKSRYDELLSLPGYEVIQFLDVDMMAVSDFTAFFDLTNNTNNILGTNERFKWRMSRFSLNGEKLPDIPMQWMVCNAPLFFRPDQKLLIEMVNCAKNIRNVSDNKFPSDIFTMNLAFYQAGVHEKILHLQDYLWTGTHTSYFNPFTSIKRTNKGWFSETGEKVYILHGRWDQPHSGNYYLSELEKRYNELGIHGKDRERQRKKVANIIKQIKEQFDEFRLRFGDY